jgi:hypothetical protein
MAMSKLAAWTIFKAVTKGQEEGLNAVAALVGDEATEYEAHVGDLNFELANAVVEVQNEGAALIQNSPVSTSLEATPAHLWVAQDYRDLVSIFEGSEHETLHLTAFFRVQNVDLMFELVKPAA